MPTPYHAVARHRSVCAFEPALHALDYQVSKFGQPMQPRLGERIVAHICRSESL